MAADHNSMLEDLATGLTAVVTRAGTGSMSGDLNMGSNKLTNLAAGTASGHSVRYEQVQLATAVATAWEGLSWAANKIGAATGAAAFTLFDYTTAGMTALNFTDPNADQLLFWDDSAATFVGIATLTGLSISGTTLAVSANLQLYSAITPSANIQTFLGAADYSAMRTQLSLTALATTTPGTGVATALAIAVGSAGAFVVNGGALGTPASGVLTNCTGLPNASVVGLGTAAVKNTGTSGNNVALLDGANTWSAAQAEANNVGWSLAETGGTIRAALKMDTSNNIEIGNANNASEYVGASHAFSGAVTNFTVNGVAVATISDAQTLSNKTIASPTLSGTVAGNFRQSGIISLGSSGDSAYFESGGVLYWQADLNDYWQFTKSTNTWAAVVGGSTKLSIDANGDLIATSFGPTSVYSLGYRGVPRRAQVTASTTLTLEDAGQYIEVTMGSASQTVTIPPNSSVAYPLGTVCEIIAMTGGNNFTIVEGAGVTLRRGDGVVATGTRTMSGSGYQTAAIQKIDTNVWHITGAFT